MRNAGFMATGAGIALILAGAALAGPGTDQRIATMKKIDARAQVLAEMADGRRDFDADAARQAAAALAALSITIPQEFEANEPGGKAKGAIWTDFDRFSTMSDKLFRTAQGFKADSPEQAAAGSAAIQATCTACHQAFKN